MKCGVITEEAVFSSDTINADKRINIYAYICSNQYFCTIKMPNMKSLRHKQATNDKNKSLSVFN